MRWLGSERNARRVAIVFKWPFFLGAPRVSGSMASWSAIMRTNGSPQCVFKLSTTITHPAVGSVAIVCSICLAKSWLSRVSEIVVASNCPRTTCQFAVTHTVPWRVYWNSSFAICPGLGGFVSACRSFACKLVISSTLMVCVLNWW